MSVSTIGSGRLEPIPLNYTHAKSARRVLLANNALEKALKMPPSNDKARLAAFQRAQAVATSYIVQSNKVRDARAAQELNVIRETAEAMKNSLIEMEPPKKTVLKENDKLKAKKSQYSQANSTSKATIASVPGFTRHNPGGHGASHCGPAAAALADALNRGITRPTELKAAEKLYPLYRERVSTYLQEEEHLEANRYRKGAVDQGFFAHLADRDATPTIIRTKGRLGEGIIHEYYGPAVVDDEGLQHMRFIINTGGHWEVLHSNDNEVKRHFFLCHPDMLNFPTLD